MTGRPRKSRTPKIELVGLAEAAQLLGLTRSGLATRRDAPGPFVGDRRPSFPKPIAELRCGPIWTRAQVLDYAAEEAWLRELTLHDLIAAQRKEGRELPPRFRRGLDLVQVGRDPDLA